MSLNFSLAFIPNIDISEFDVQLDARISTDEATTAGAINPSAVQVGPNVLLAGGFLDPASIPHVEDPQRRTVVIMLGGTSDVYSLQTFGESARLRVLQFRVVVEDEGTPLEVESVFEVNDDPEDAHVEIFCRLAGVTDRQLWELEWAPPRESF